MKYRAVVKQNGSTLGHFEVEANNINSAVNEIEATLKDYGDAYIENIYLIADNHKFMIS